jgi:hypothetical protein
MANRIVIKLNRSKYEDLIKDIRICDGELSKNNTECVMKCLFFCHELFFKKNKAGELGFDLFLRYWYEEGTTREKACIEFNKRFIEFQNRK